MPLEFLFFNLYLTGDVARSPSSGPGRMQRPSASFTATLIHVRAELSPSSSVWLQNQRPWLVGRRPRSLGDFLRVPLEPGSSSTRTAAALMAQDLAGRRELQERGWTGCLIISLVLGFTGNIARDAAACF